MADIIFIGINVNDLLEEFRQLIKSELKKALTPPQVQTQSTYLSRKDVAKLLKITLPTLSDWTKLGYLQSYKIRNRVLYKQEEVEQSLHQVLNQKHKRLPP